MLDKPKNIKISKSVHSKDDLDFDFLKSTGIDYIESMGGSLWTDMNVHDPGITFLDTICYAITDLSSRINLPIESLIASENDLNLKNQFYQAHQILPSAPTTAMDYRKLFSDIPGVRNSWIVAYDHDLEVDYGKSVIAYSSSKFPDPNTKRKRSIKLRGLNRVIVDYDLLDQKPNGTLVTQEWINEEIRKVYHANRNLCEDLVDIIPVQEHPIGVCATIELEPNVDEDFVHAQVLSVIENYFSPGIEHRSLKEMLERGYRTDEIYEGPFLKNGFIDNADLKVAGLRRDVRLSDIVNVIMDIEGVKLIQDISIKDCKKNKDGLGWTIEIGEYTKPVLCPTEKPAKQDDKKCCTLSSFSYLKNVLPVTVNQKNVQRFKEEIISATKAKIAAASLERTLKVKRGTFIDSKETTTIQNVLPETYGISPYGLPANSSVKRKSQALQLKGYLTFFDQILVSYFAHLSKVKDLLSINTGVVPTYFTQAIKDIKDFDKVVSDYPTSDDVELTEKLMKSLDDSIERRNEILDHLLARFAETFSEYTFLMHELYGKASDEMVLLSKEQFLKEYVEFSSTRGTAYNVYGDVWNTTNVAGTQKRISRLSGITNYQRRNLSNPLVSVYKTETGEYRWWIKEPPDKKIVSSSGGFVTSSMATKEMYRCVFELVNTSVEKVKAAFEKGVGHDTRIDNIVIHKGIDDKYKFNVIDPEKPEGSGFDIIGVHSSFYEDLSELEVNIIETINYLKSGFNEEGMFLIEHIFLLPDLNNKEADLDLFLNVCIEDEKDCCSMDPYSFRVSVVLPGYTQRYSDPDFRNYLELLIQSELPAHVVPRICWIGYREGQEDQGELNELVTLEIAYQAFLESVKNNKLNATEIPKTVLKDFKEILFNLHSLHPSGRLHDCESDDDLEGKIILGRTNLGTLQHIEIMEHKLTDITKSFHSFAKDQVLTERQLNEFLDYFDEQDRLSRICLSGVGIVCGFDVTTDEVSKEITISKGAGITTDGDLVNFHKTRLEGEKSITELANSLKFTHYRTFHGDKVNYDPQFDTLDGDPFTLIPLVELVPEGENSGEDKLLNLFPSLDKQVILIYIESYAKDRDNCVGVDCENQGIEQVNKLRVLLVDEQNINRIIKPDNLFNAQAAVESFLDENDVYVPRVILSKENSATAPGLASLYYSNKLSSAVASLKFGIESLLKDNQFKAFKSYVFNAIDEVFSTTYDNLVFFQYRYDFLKDLVDSYNELKRTFLEKGNFCCPDINAFPKHLMLGNPYAKVFKEKDNTYVNKYRHSFFKSPILTSNNGNEEFNLVLKRIEELCKAYRRRRYFDADLLRITPSNVRVQLGKRAIPYYYSYSEQLIRNWDFQRRKYNQHLSILGYSQGLNAPADSRLGSPLNYSIDPYDFFRIEGHQGLSYEEALKAILNDKKKYSLPFDVKVLGITVKELDGLLNDQYKCAYRDLEVLLNAWASEQECISSEVAYILSSFSIKEQGSNLVEKDFYQIAKSPVKGTLTRNPSISDGFNSSTTEVTTDPVKSFRVVVSDNSGDVDKSLGLNTSVDVSGDLVKGVRPSSNVQEFINKDVDSLGYLINDSIEQAKGNFDSAFAIALNNADVVVNNWDQILATSTIKLPLKIVFSVTKLASLIPNRIEDLSGSTLEDYNAEIAKLCSYTKQLQNQFRSNNELFVSKVTTDTRGMVSLLINQLTTICCSAKKMQSLLLEVESRKESVLSRLDFSRFVDQNPGLEHKGGVGPGQTFVMVYVNSAITNRAKEDFVFSEVDEVDQLPSRRRASQIIPKGTVIADFTLPYMCCSDCESVNFVLPKIPVELSLNSDSYCIDNKNLELEFTVVPQDGIITVADAVAGVVIEDNKLRIDPELFPPELLGTKLKFKVNSEKTDLELLVSKRPEVSIVATESPVGSRNVNFTISGDDQPDFKYSWSFGDGNTSNERNPTHKYALSDKSELFNINLTITPGAGICPAVLSEQISFEGVVINIDAGPYCESDESINIDINPKGANPEIIGAGVSADGTQFIPALAGPGVHQLFFNNVLIQTITVNPAARISGEISLNEFDEKLNLSVSASNVTGYNWMITLPNNIILTYSDAEPSIPLTEFSSLKSGDIVKIEVQVENGCGSDSTTIDYVIPDVAIPAVTLPTKNFCVENSSKVNFTTVNFTAATELAIDGVPVTNDPLSFVPAELSVGTHTISIDGVVQYTIDVSKKPGGYIDTQLTSSGYIFEFIQDSEVSIDQMVWQFFEDGNEGAGVIRAEITGRTLVNVPYDSFNFSTWKKLKVVLKLDNKCGGNEVLTVVDAPVRSVKVTLEENRYIYCNNDQGSYQFLFSPDTGDTVLNGKGVFGNVFRPYQISEGNHTIFVSNGPDISVRIVDPNVGTADAPVYDAERGTLALNFVPRSSASEFSILWEVYRNSPGDIPEAKSEELSYLVPVKELGIKEGEKIQIQLTKNVQYCGSSSTVGAFTIPLDGTKGGEGEVIVDPQKCDELFLNAYSTLKSALPTKIEQEYLTELQLSYMNDILKIIDFGLEKPNDVISGVNNDEIFTEITRLLSEIKKAALSARSNNPERFAVLMSLYEILLMVYANALRCQDILKVGQSINELSLLLEVHFDPKNSSSFPMNGVNVIDVNQHEQLNAILANRDTSVQPWAALLGVVTNDLR